MWLRWWDFRGCWVLRAWSFFFPSSLLLFFVAVVVLGPASSRAEAAEDRSVERSDLRIKERGRALSTYIELDYARDHSLQWGVGDEFEYGDLEHPRKRLNEIFGPLYARLKLTQIAPLRTSSSDCRGSPVANIFHALGYGRQSGIISISLSTSLLRNESGMGQGAKVPTLQAYPILVMTKEGTNCSYEWVGEKALTPWVLTGTNGIHGGEVEIEILHQIASGQDLSRARRMLSNARSLAELLSSDVSDGIVADLTKLGHHKDLLRTVDDLVSSAGRFRNLSSMKGKVLPFEATTGDPFDRLTLKIPKISTNGNRVKILEDDLQALFAVEVEYRPTMFAECSSLAQKHMIVGCAGFDLTDILSRKIADKSIHDIANSAAASPANGAYVGFLGKLWSASQAAKSDKDLRDALQRLCRRDWDLNEMDEFKGLNKLDRLLVKYALLSEIVDYNRRPGIQVEECISHRARKGALSEEQIIRSLTLTDLDHVIETEDPQSWARRIARGLALEFRKINETNLEDRFGALFIGNAFELVIHPEVSWLSGPGGTGSEVRSGFQGVSRLAGLELEIPAYCSLNNTDVRATKERLGFWMTLQSGGRVDKPLSVAVVVDLEVSKDGEGPHGLDGMKVKRLQFVAAGKLLEELGWAGSAEGWFVKSGCAKGRNLEGIKAHLARVED